MPSVALAISGRAGFATAEFDQLARAAETAGFSHVLATETASDPVAYAMGMAATTDTITVGTAITNLVLRHPVAMAMTAAVAADASGGRFVLGVGLGNPGFNRDVVGLAPTPPLATVREYVTVFRQALAGTVDHDGEVYDVHGLELTRRPDALVPVHVAALQPGMLTLAGEVADGAILHLSSPASAAASARVVRAAAEQAGRNPAEVLVSCMIPVCVDDDEALALEAARQTVLRYALHPVANKLFAASGHGEQMGRIAQLLLDGDDDAARAAVDADLARSFVAHGSPAACRDQVAAYAEAGIDLPIAFPMPAAGGDWRTCLDDTIHALAPLAVSP